MINEVRINALYFDNFEVDSVLTRLGLDSLGGVDLDHDDLVCLREQLVAEWRERRD